MTWTKLGQEFPDDARKLSDAAFRTHVEGLCWANRVGSDLIVEADDLGRFAATAEPKVAIAELVAKGWWETRREGWYLGLRRKEWQLESSVVEKRREMNAVRQQRHRMHAVGDHALCTERCSEVRNVTRDVTETRDPDRSGTDRNGSDVVLGRHIPTQVDDDDLAQDQIEYEQWLESGGNDAA